MATERTNSKPATVKANNRGWVAFIFDASTIGDAALARMRDAALASFALKGARAHGGKGNRMVVNGTRGDGGRINDPIVPMPTPKGNMVDAYVGVSIVFPKSSNFSDEADARFVAMHGSVDGAEPKADAPKADDLF